VSTAELAALADRIVPILVFVLCLTVVAELADRIGVFAVLADRVAWLAGGVVWRLWLLVAALAAAATIVLSLDTTAVLLTPVVLSLAGQLRLDRGLFAYTAVWLANTASLLLPVSNLTNLLSLHVLGLRGERFVALTAPAAIAAIAITVGLLAVIFRRSLRGRYVRGEAPEVHHDRPLLIIAMAICLVIGPLFATGLDVTVVSAAAAVVLVLACVVRDRSLLSWRLLPWPLLLGVSILFVLVQLAHDHAPGSPSSSGWPGGARGALIGWTTCPPTWRWRGGPPAHRRGWRRCWSE
jgi:arsenical pump membrane protein